MCAGVLRYFSCGTEGLETATLIKPAF